MGSIQLKTPPELARMRQAGRIVAEVLRLIEDIAEPGTTTEQLDQAAADYIAKQGGEAAFYGYRGFPASICTSVNEEVVHGIPGPRKLREGDLLKADVGVIWEGYYGDGAVTVAIGDVAELSRRLLVATREALHDGIAVVRPGVRVSEVAAAIQQSVERCGFSVVTEYTGHGIGRALHEEPKVPNFVPRRFGQHDCRLETGTVIAIEPMVNEGTHRTELLDNGWTVVTKDRKLSAHFEHTVAIDETGPVILTVP
jgi:methionyl aminopeptidase